MKIIKDNSFIYARLIVYSILFLYYIYLAYFTSFECKGCPLCGMTRAIKSILMIGGFVTIFSVILSILNNTKIITIISYFISNIFHINPDYIVGLLTGFLEFTNGLYKISTINNKMLSINLIISSFIIGFGGISVTLQVLNIISKNKLSIKTYIFGKLLHGTISALFTFLILSIPIFSLNL